MAHQKDEAAFLDFEIDVVERSGAVGVHERNAAEFDHVVNSHSGVKLRSYWAGAGRYLRVRLPVFGAADEKRDAPERGPEHRTEAAFSASLWSEV
ncbi:hypothetical protein WPS_00610 [Vulcanimicrobium alpinum]|uniref:Uncharacterized protein n=1 Tax=Vulcanimicrobium alpinum TaxID=3016050 RepID=A0AAN2C779_UNVUL|nr:hypothetical protein WPS_00610 [Vulcanimicrobium alpinum]